MKRSWLVWSVVGGLMASCGDSTSPPPDPAGSTSATSGAGGSVTQTISVEVIAQNAVNEAPIPGVEICLLDVNLPCATTDAEGRATVSAPANSEVWASLVGEGFVSALVGALTAEEDLELTAPLINQNLVSFVAESAGQEFEPTKGHVVFVALLPPAPGTTKYPPAPGVRIALEPASGSGPHYVNALNLVDETLTATGPAGGALWLNIEPGPSELVTEGDASCVHFVAQPIGASDRFGVRTLANFVTYVTVMCPSDGPGAGGGGMGGAGGGSSQGGAGGVGGAGGGAGGTGGTGGAGTGGAGGA